MSGILGLKVLIPVRGAAKVTESGFFFSSTNIYQILLLVAGCAGVYALIVFYILTIFKKNIATPQAQKKKKTKTR